MSPIRPIMFLRKEKMNFTVPNITITNLRKPWEFISTDTVGHEEELAKQAGYIDYSIGYYEPEYDEVCRIIDGVRTMSNLFKSEQRRETF